MMSNIVRWSSHDSGTVLKIMLNQWCLTVNLSTGYQLKSLIIIHFTQYLETIDFD